MNKLNKIYEELQLIEEFESNFNITKESKERREYLLKIINKMKIDIEKEEINDLIEFILKNDKERDINFLKNQTIDELEDIKDNIINR